ncbi:hypothetical protein [Vibrio cholerae]|uniref:hypothetical protein n=1 Tax=Vibrio cholerae TaxID=666 RepID=UPI000E0A84AA|nr:hypothetical protein [Vibrio cholerae]EGR1312189.1 hypothetical protein [Vibrio cholerae]TQQ57369.1 hypothetical protein FLL63_16265 [Vibrio cholerae]HAS3165986.1 hypothetical protein [Vibrio cholerae]
MSSITSIKQLQSSPLAGLFLEIYNQIQKKQDANQTYLRLKVLLDDQFMKGARFNSPEVSVIVEMLRELAPFGARRRNFESMYLKDEYSLRKLPNDPRDIPFGYWY